METCRKAETKAPWGAQEPSFPPSPHPHPHVLLLQFQSRFQHPLLDRHRRRHRQLFHRSLLGLGPRHRRHCRRSPRNHPLAFPQNSWRRLQRLWRPRRSHWNRRCHFQTCVLKEISMAKSARRVFSIRGLLAETITAVEIKKQSRCTQARAFPRRRQQASSMGKRSLARWPKTPPSLL